MAMMTPQIMYQTLFGSSAIKARKEEKCNENVRRSDGFIILSADNCKKVLCLVGDKNTFPRGDKRDLCRQSSLR